MAKRTLQERIVEADVRASQYLGAANDAEECGQMDKADKLREKCQFWMDRETLLRGWANAPAPKK